jgi:hypothetical protein
MAQGEEPGEPGHDADMGGAVLMTATASGAHFEIKVDGVVRSCRDFRETAIEAARFLSSATPTPRSSSRTCGTDRMYRINRRQ